MKARYIPNILSVIRIILVYVFAYVFMAYYPEGIAASVLIFIFSGLTDVLDGALARHFGWVSRLGIILDPIADKLMQCTVVLCTSLKGLTPWWIFAFYITKEGMMAAGAFVLFKRHREVYGSKIFGKVATVLYYTIIAVILIWGNRIDKMVINVLCIAMALAAVVAFVLYFTNYMYNKKQELPDTETKGRIQN